MLVNLYTAFSITADLRHHTSSILQFLIAYFIGRKLVSYFGLEKKWPRMHQILNLTLTFSGEKGHYCVSVTTTTPWPAQKSSPPPASIPLSSNGIAVFLPATTDELLPNFCKGSSTLFPTEKAVYNQILYYLYIYIFVIHRRFF